MILTVYEVEQNVYSIILALTITVIVFIALDRFSR